MYSFNKSNVSKSRSFVGSSNNNNCLGLANIFANNNLFFCPPDNVETLSSTAAGSNKKFFKYPQICLLTEFTSK